MYIVQYTGAVSLQSIKSLQIHVVVRCCQCAACRGQGLTHNSYCCTRLIKFTCDAATNHLYIVDEQHMSTSLLLNAACNIPPQRYAMQQMARGDVASHVTSLYYVLVTCMVYTWCAKHKNAILQRILMTSCCCSAWQSLPVGTLTRAARASVSTTGWGWSNPYLVANTRLAPINSGTASRMHHNKHGITFVCTLM